MKLHRIKLGGMCLSILLFSLCAASVVAQDGTPITAGNAGRLEAVGSFGADGAFASNTSIAISPDNQSVAACGVNGGVELWNTDTGAARLLLDVPCSIVAFSPDGTLIAASNLLEVSLYDADSREKVGTYPGSTFAFSPDGQTLAIVTSEGVLTMYAAPAGSAPSAPAAATPIPFEPTDAPAAAVATAIPLAQPTTSSGATCTLTASTNANLRNGPSTSADRTGLVVVNNTMIADGQTRGADGMTWYHLDSNEWVRADLVSEPPNCSALPVRTP